MKLEVGQHYETTSAIALEYEKMVGMPFRFAFKIYSLEKRQPTPTGPVVGDVYCQLVNWQPRKHDTKWPMEYICDCLCMGHDKYGDPALNYSSDLINGGTWYVPHLFRWQHRLLYLIGNDVIQLIDPQNWRSVDTAALAR
ncbi:hypothetical protein [Chitinophaga filiformis]|uniref:Uncharacterized protein n=1 Tax=Chitinophaga filiformis TaxID=104663 RepID=A0ABY4HWU3_CHIFI|nr:hypothetical protein [Chitinophaga filiformis]UPK68007.1 hypothetical protein MYF79_23935 [Chitinophaga filiformis]